MGGQWLGRRLAAQDQQARAGRRVAAVEGVIAAKLDFRRGGDLEHSIGGGTATGEFEGAGVDIDGSGVVKPGGDGIVAGAGVAGEGAGIHEGIAGATAVVEARRISC